MKNLLILVFSLLAAPAFGQFQWLGVHSDTSYVDDYSRDLTIRLNVTRRYYSYRMTDDKLEQHLNYKPNTPLNVGFGFNYKAIGLNFGYNLPQVGDNEKYGNTHVIDLSAHVYLRKLLIDLYGMSYNGFYLANTVLLTTFPPGQNAYLRPDIHTRNAGLSVDYVFNPERYSFRAAYLQNEHQKKSSGSFLIGADVHANYVRADSSLVPTAIAYPSFFDGQEFNRTKSYSASVSAGYAYTFVIKRRFFFLMGFQAGLGLNYTIMKESESGHIDEKFGPAYHTTLRLAGGYNSKRYFVGVHYVGVGLYGTSPYANGAQRFSIDNFRFSIARRFKMKKPLIGRF